jgi:hypothetical protein
VKIRQLINNILFCGYRRLEIADPRMLPKPILAWAQVPQRVKSDFHLSNGVFPIFCYEISATALAGRFCVARGTRDTKIQVIKCQFPVCISLAYPPWISRGN